MYWVLGGVFITFYGLMAFAVRRIIKFLELQKDCDDQPTMDKCDGKAKYLIGLVMSVGVALIFVNWFIIWFGHIRYAY